MTIDIYVDPSDYADPKKDVSKARITKYDRLPEPRKYYATLDQMLNDINHLLETKTTGIVRFRDTHRAIRHRDVVKGWLRDMGFTDKGLTASRLGRRVMVVHT